MTGTTFFIILLVAVCVAIVYWNYRHHHHFHFDPQKLDSALHAEFQNQEEVPREQIVKHFKQTFRCTSKEALYLLGKAKKEGLVELGETTVRRIAK